MRPPPLHFEDLGRPDSCLSGGGGMLLLFIPSSSGLSTLFANSGLFHSKIG
ncbi:unnamed protein product [Haemonchus placei]|uniref:Uncharacterized protein n=1 Tax=Haemonchus placei TaxID=6290 RepID=A0A0N4X2Z3_HAEPC|nr:unnamed protein product [Haemonchus placei]